SCAAVFASPWLYTSRCVLCVFGPFQSRCSPSSLCCMAGHCGGLSLRHHSQPYSYSNAESAIGVVSATARISTTRLCLSFASAVYFGWRLHNQRNSNKLLGSRSDCLGMAEGERQQASYSR